MPKQCYPEFASPFLYRVSKKRTHISCFVSGLPGRTRTCKVYRYGDVRSVITTFISHQDDTQQKHDQVVSVAEFNPDGSLIRMTNHLTYLYDYAEPVIADFWSDPNGDALVYLMDGLEMGGKWNFIYVNEWPAKYAEVIEDRGHPRYKGLNDANYGRFNYNPYILGLLGI